MKLQVAGHGNVGFLAVKVKMAGQEYPIPLAQEVTCKVRRVLEKPIGIDLDLQDGISAYVIGIKEGPFLSYNDTVKPEEQLRVGDFITRVNGVNGTSGKILEQLMRNTTLEVTIRRPMEFNIFIDRTDLKEPLGIGVTRSPIGTSVLITGIMEGPVSEWNKANSDSVVQSGDRIVAVRGKRGSAAELIMMTKAIGHLEVTIARAASAQS